jgi:hypothetical protein
MTRLIGSGLPRRRHVPTPPSQLEGVYAVLVPVTSSGSGIRHQCGCVRGRRAVAGVTRTARRDPGEFTGRSDLQGGLLRRDLGDAGWSSVGARRNHRGRVAIRDRICRRLARAAPAVVVLRDVRQVLHCGGEDQYGPAHHRSRSLPRAQTPELHRSVVGYHWVRTDVGESGWHCGCGRPGVDRSRLPPPERGTKSDGRPR